MVPPLDPFWAYVDDMSDGCKKCKFCEQTYARGTSVSRVKHHLSGLRGAGVKICEMVPKAVQAAACAAIDGRPRKKIKTAASSSSNQADNITVLASLTVQNSGAEDGMTDRSLGRALESLQMHVGGIELHGGGTSPGDHMVDAAETAQQEEMEIHSQLPTTFQSTDSERRWMIDDDLINGEEDNGMAGFSVGAALEWLQRNGYEIDLDDGGTSPEVLMVDPAENTLRTMQVGQEYETTYNISSSFLEDNVISNNPENATTGLMQRVEGSGFFERCTVDEAEQPENVVSNNPENATTGLMQQVEGSRFLERSTVDEAGELMHQEMDDVLMNAEGNMPTEPGQTVVRDGLQQIAAGPGGEAFQTPKLIGERFEKYKNARNNKVSLIGRAPERAHIIESMVDAAEIAHIMEEVGQKAMQMHSQLPTTLQPTDPECRRMIDDVLTIDEENMIEHNVQVSQDCEATFDIPCLSTGDNFVSNNIECASMGLMQHLAAGGVLEKFTVDEDGQPTDLQCQANERHGNQICFPSVSNDVLRNDEANMTTEPEQPGVGDGPRESLQHITGDGAGGDVFPTSKLQGGAFEENKNVIWSWLMNNEVSLIGIYGMGGVGKTTLMKHIYNQLLNKPDKYRHVYWITVSQDFSIYELQNLIARRIGLDLSNEEDEMHRAAKLLKELAERQNYVIILDDLWNHFEPEEMGIPSKMDGCKLILTTRLLDVCLRMGCERNVIKVQPLLEEEAWNLFKTELGNYDIKLEHLAKSVADECDGLPLGVITMARSMRGVYDEREWRNALVELKEARVRLRDMEPEVFRILRYSFLHLNDSKLQQCFLCCALFPEGFPIKREELIEFFISERMIEGRKSRQAEFDKGHEMLNQLENACLLESDGGKRVVRMHDLVRDMALQQMRGNSHVMVEAGEQLEELPDEEKWSQDLVRVSLMQNDIKEIPSGRSPGCPSLSILLLNGNWELKFIGDSFFKQMKRLEVLDLSKTAIQELPDSISDLVTLTALLLGGCRHLNHVPSLRKLKVLQKLDLGGTDIRELPRGLEFLSSLRYLNLNRSKIREFPVNILPKLCHLQVFRLCEINPLSSRTVTLKVEELTCLRKLETLECNFDDLHAFKKYLKYLDHKKKETQPPSIFKFVIGQMEVPAYYFSSFFSKGMDRGIYLHRQEIKGRRDVWVLPKGIEKLVMEECSDVKSLCDFYPSQHETELKSLLIACCHSMECLVSFSQISLNMLGTIERLRLYSLDNLSFIFSKARAAPTPLLPGNGVFSHLKTLQIIHCRKLETLFPPGVLPNLRNLEEIGVRSCSNLEKIISEEESNISSSGLAIEFSLSKLRSLRFRHLPALTSFGCGKLVCNSLQKIRISYCERLKRLPFSCFPRTVKDIGVWPKIWWKSVEWDLKNDHTVQFKRW